jgi:hypothetical protein
MGTTASRLKEWIDYKKISMREFELIFGFSNGSISSQIRNNNTISSDRIELILRYYVDLNPLWLLTGKGKMIRNEVEVHTLAEPIDHSYGKEIPVYDLIAGRNDVATESQADEYINAGDLFRDAQAVMRVFGNSMEPKYPAGSFLPIKILNDFTLVIPGQDYVIQTKEYRVLKRLQKSAKENCYLACSINEEVYQNGEMAGKLIHEPFDVLIDDIISISIVLGCVTRNQISNKF